MSATSHSVHQFSLIFDEIYTQKHNQFSDLISKWHQDKQQCLVSSYIKNIGHLYQEIDSDHKKFQKRIHELLKVINSEFQIFSKVKILNEQKDVIKNHNIIIVQSSLAHDESEMFQSIVNRIHKKSNDINELSQFASRFFAITSTELNQFKSLTSQIQNHKERYLFDYKKQSVEDTKILNQLCLKNESKYFQVKNFQKLRQLLQKQVKILSKTDDDVREYYKQSLHKRRQILQNCIDNMTRYEELSVRIFSDNMVGQIMQYFNKLVEELSKLISLNQVKEKQYINVKEHMEKDLSKIYKQNLKIFNFIMEDITLGEWKYIVLETTKKSSFSSFSSLNFTSHPTIREDTLYNDSNKQFSVPACKDASLFSENQMLMTLTIDYKLIFRKMNQKSKIYKEYFLNDLKIKSQKDRKKVLDEKTLVLKEKNNKQKLQISFSDADKREEFILHLQRFEQLKNTLGK